MKKEMLINVLQPEECRIAIIEDGVLEELYVERTSHESYVGNIYKGRIVNIEPSIQAAFVDFGVGRNGFLHVSDVEPAYYRHLEQNGGAKGERRGRDRYRGRGRPGDEDSGHSGPERRREGDEAGQEVLAQPPGMQDQETWMDLDGGNSLEPIPKPEDLSPDQLFASAGEKPLEKTPTDPGDRGNPFGEETPPQARYMGSAEHRTNDDRNTGCREEILSEDDIFFPRAETSGAPSPSSWPEEHAQNASIVAESSVASPPDYSTAAVLPTDDTTLIDDKTWAEERGERTGEELPTRFEEDQPQRRSSRQRDRRQDRRGGGRRGSGRANFGKPKPLIQDIFRRGQEVLVQVIKEGIGTKGPTLSTYISIAGRYLVLMPGLNRVGVSRKIADDEQRRRLRQIFTELKPPKGLGFIIRTAGIERNKKELQGDLAYLARLWQVVVRRIRKSKAPAEIYQESDMITRTIRDTFTSDIDTIWVDEPTAYEHAKEFLQIVMPRYAGRIKLYTETEPLFHKYGIEDEISRIQQRHVPLPNGGSIVIDQTEALVAIDVNSGNFRADNNAEETAFQVNLLAAKEIARQLRLRDLGGVIVNDFIDMRDENRRRAVERALRDAIKRDRARTKVLRISQFGLIEMTRQRIRPSLKRSVFQDCPHCLGTGQVKTCESMSIDVMRMLQRAAHRERVSRIQIRVAEDVANYLQNKKRKDISRLEESGNIQIHIIGVAGAPPETLDFECYDNNNNEIKLLSGADENKRR